MAKSDVEVKDEENPSKKNEERGSEKETREWSVFHVKRSLTNCYLIGSARTVLKLEFYNLIPLTRVRHV